MTAEEKNNGASRSATILVLLSAGLALIPGVGFIMWLVGVPVAFVVFILSIVMLAKGQTMDGMIGLAFALALPIWFFAAPIISTSVFGVKTEDSNSDSVVTPPGNSTPAPDSKPGTTVSDAIAEAVADPVALVAERAWTSTDGRKLRAALLDVVRDTDGLFVGKFLRDDGLEFDLQIGKLAPADVDIVKQAMVSAGLWNGGE